MKSVLLFRFAENYGWLGPYYKILCCLWLMGWKIMSSILRYDLSKLCDNGKIYKAAHLIKANRTTYLSNCPFLINILLKTYKIDFFLENYFEENTLKSNKNREVGVEGWGETTYYEKVYNSILTSNFFFFFFCKNRLLILKFEIWQNLEMFIIIFSNYELNFTSNFFILILLLFHKELLAFIFLLLTWGFRLCSTLLN